ncbi:MAG: DUF4097 family beta strand repeat-containing protein [Rhodothermales bacterium]
MRLFTMLSGLFLVGALITTTAQAQHEKTLRFTEKLDENGTLAVGNHKGSITVTTWERKEVEVAVRVVADGDEEMVEGTEVNVYRSGRTLHLETDYENARRSQKKLFGLISTDGYSSPFVHYEIQMPRTARLDIDDHKSDIHVADLDADLRIDTHKGVVEVDNLDGALRLDTHKGTVRVRFSHLAGSSTIETYKGDVTLMLPPDAGFDLYADLGRRGDLDTDFSLRGVRHWDDEAYRATVNGGGPRLRLDTYKGSIALRTR